MVQVLTSTKILALHGHLMSASKTHIAPNISIEEISELKQIFTAQDDVTEHRVREKTISQR